MPYNYGDALTAMAAMADGRPRRRAQLQPMPTDLVDLPGSIQDPQLPIVSRSRARNPGLRRQGLIPMVPPFTNPTGPGFNDPTGIGGFMGAAPRVRRRGQLPMNSLLGLQPGLMPSMGYAGPTPMGGLPMAAPSLTPNTIAMPNIGNLLGGGGFGFGG
jgi:hypothetical protein